MRTVLIALLLWSSVCFSKDFTDRLFDDYDRVYEKSLNVQRIKHAQLEPLINRFSGQEAFTVRELGHSIEGRSISLISLGEGDIDILLWSQMHGDEPTATMAIFDLLNMLAIDDLYEKEKRRLLQKVKLHFLPMLNPDGAERYTRRNALGIDINRDARRLQTPEGKILKRIRDELDAEFGFNLHDQSRYYNPERIDKPATISYLAPAYNHAKDINDVRAGAMQLIVLMSDILQRYVPGQIGRYSDEFEPRAFGDNIQKWGTSTILIESGGQYDDPEKQVIRKLNYISIATAIFAIADGSFKTVDISRYEDIPNNDRKLFDLKIEAATYGLNGKDYVVDIGIQRVEIENEEERGFHYLGKIDELGDLSTHYGYQNIDANGLRIEPAGKAEIEKLSQIDFQTLLSEGVAYAKTGEVNSMPYSPYPLHLLAEHESTVPQFGLGKNATFLLKAGDDIKYVIVNGFVFDSKKPNFGIRNSLIYK